MTDDLKLGPSMIVVRDIETARGFFSTTLGAVCGEPHNVAYGGFRRCFVEIGGGVVQLMQPLEGEKVLTRFLEKHGEGLYGLVYLTTDVAAVKFRLEQAGTPLVGDVIDLGDMLELVIHPKATHGVLTVIRQLI